eukprot:scaffold191776_cov18-Tisochrysis_lutea.AAC.1
MASPIGAGLRTSDGPSPSSGLALPAASIKWGRAATSGKGAGCCKAAASSVKVYEFQSHGRRMFWTCRQIVLHIVVAVEHEEENSYIMSCKSIAHKRHGHATSSDLGQKASLRLHCEAKCT